MEQYIEGLDVFTGQPIGVTYNDEKIINVSSISTDGALLSWLAPGLFDLQINGYMGYDFNSDELTASNVQAITKALLQIGVTAYLPTIITNSDENISKLIGVIVEACHIDELTRSCIKGIHIEGPFISPVDGARGAHDIQYVKAPCWELVSRWQQEAQGLIKLITISPEWDKAESFIRQCVENGIEVSIGHTTANSLQINNAVRAGARLSTHLGNGAQLQLPRHPNYIWDQLAEDELAPTVIADGFHLPYNVLKVFMKAKPEQIMLVSDAVHLCGMKPGQYKTHIGGDVTLTEEGKLYLTNHPNMLAGSAVSLLSCVNYVVQHQLAPLAAAWEMASLRPAKSMNLDIATGIESNAPADMVLFRNDGKSIIIQEVIKCGKNVFRNEL